jgi:hypothetical protein
MANQKKTKVLVLDHRLMFPIASFSLLLQNDDAAEHNDALGRVNNVTRGPVHCGDVMCSKTVGSGAAPVRTNNLVRKMNLPHN